MKYILTILLLLSIDEVYSQCNNLAPVTYNLVQTSPGELFRPNTSAWKGGDTLRIMGTNYSVIEFFGGGGDVCRPIVIVANTQFFSPAIRFKGGAHHYKMLSTGAGLDTTTFRSIKANNVTFERAHHITLEGAEVYGSTVGIYNKENVVFSDPTTWYGQFTQTGNKAIGCFIHDIDGEGMYWGLTQENGYSGTSPFTGWDTVIVGTKLDSCEIAYNYVTRCSWDGIQIASSVSGNKIHHNIVTNYGYKDLPGQKTGITLGGESPGSVYSNVIKKGTGSAIALYGYSTVNVYDNIIDSAGWQVAGSPEAAIYAVYHTVSYRSVPPLQVNIYNNQIDHPKTLAIRNNTNGNEIAGNVSNNRFCIPGANPVTWQNSYLVLDVPGTVRTNNILYCEESPPVNTCSDCFFGGLLRN